MSSYRRLLMDLVLTGAHRIRDITRVAAPVGSTPGHVVRVAADGESLELAEPTGGAGLDLTGRAHGDVLWVDTSGDAPAAAWLAVPSDWATGDPYVLTIGAARPMWRRAVGVVLDIPDSLTVDADSFTADSTVLTADQTEIA